MNDQLPALTQFILPSGNGIAIQRPLLQLVVGGLASAHLHMARSVSDDTRFSNLKLRPCRFVAGLKEVWCT